MIDYRYEFNVRIREVGDDEDDDELFAYFDNYGQALQVVREKQNQGFVCTIDFEVREVDHEVDNDCIDEFFDCVQIGIDFITVKPNFYVFCNSEHDKEAIDYFDTYKEAKDFVDNNRLEDRNLYYTIEVILDTEKAGVDSLDDTQFDPIELYRT